MKAVFHASPVGSLKEIWPNRNGQLFAAHDKLMSVPFLSRYGGGSIIGIWRNQSKVPVITENLPNAFDFRYRNEPGTIYSLQHNASFEQGQWSEEVISTKSHIPIEVENIPDVRNHLDELIGSGKIKLLKWQGSTSDEAVLACLKHMISVSGMNGNHIKLAKDYLEFFDRMQLSAQLDTWLTCVMSIRLS